jgi:hypothetical protein
VEKTAFLLDSELPKGEEKQTPEVHSPRSLTLSAASFSREKNDEKNDEKSEKMDQIDDEKSAETEQKTEVEQIDDELLQLMNNFEEKCEIEEDEESSRSASPGPLPLIESMQTLPTLSGKKKREIFLLLIFLYYYLLLVTDRLKRLKELHQEELITEAEYVAKRKEILDSL